MRSIGFAGRSVRSIEQGTHQRHERRVTSGTFSRSLSDCRASLIAYLWLSPGVPGSSARAFHAHFGCRREASPRCRSRFRQATYTDDILKFHLSFHPVASTNDIRAAIRPVKYTMKLQISTMCSSCPKPQVLLRTLDSRSITIDCNPSLSIPEIELSSTSA